MTINCRKTDFELIDLKLSTLDILLAFHGISSLILYMNTAVYNPSNILLECVGLNTSHD